MFVLSLSNKMNFNTFKVGYTFLRFTEQHIFSVEANLFAAGFAFEWDTSF
jgi:hypothetical protein